MPVLFLDTVRMPQDADCRYSGYLLRVSHHRAHCDDTTNDFKEIPPSHCLPRGSGRGIVTAQMRIRKDPAMSALGQKQTNAAQQRMSALPSIATAKADMCSAKTNVC